MHTLAVKYKTDLKCYLIIQKVSELYIPNKMIKKQIGTKDIDDFCVRDNLKQR